MIVLREQGGLNYDMPQPDDGWRQFDAKMYRMNEAYMGTVIIIIIYICMYIKTKARMCIYIYTH